MFICGLPGGIDYLLLFLVKHQKIERLEEKRWNARINVWLRSPGLLTCAVFMYLAIMHDEEESACTKNRLETALTAALVFLNGQYYMQVVVGNTFRKNEKYNS